MYTADSDCEFRKNVHKYNGNTMFIQNVNETSFLHTQATTKQRRLQKQVGLIFTLPVLVSTQGSFNTFRYYFRVFLYATLKYFAHFGWATPAASIMDGASSSASAVEDRAASYRW
jgi:hypothetical protein